MPSSYEKLITAAALAVSVGAVGIMLSVGGCASSNIDTTSPDSYLVITNLEGVPGEDGGSIQGVLQSDCWEDDLTVEPDPFEPGEERDCCIVGGGIYHSDYLNVTVANNGKTGMEGQFQEVHFTSFRIVYNTAGSPIYDAVLQPFFFMPTTGTGNTEGDVVEGTLDVSLEVGSTATISILAVPIVRKPMCPTFLFPATITLFGTDISGDGHAVSSSFQVQYGDWLGSACEDKPDCGTVMCLGIGVGVDSDSPVEDGSPVTFTATVVGGVMPVTFEWDFEDPSGVDITSTPGTDTDTQSFIYPSDGTYVCKVTVTDMCPTGGETATVSVAVTVTVPAGP
jgi:hypothetical protein